MINYLFSALPKECVVIFVMSDVSMGVFVSWPANQSEIDNMILKKINKFEN